VVKLTGYGTFGTSEGDAVDESQFKVTPSTEITKKDLAQAVFYSLMALIAIKRELGLEV
jgi:hypothetical protein